MTAITRLKKAQPDAPAILAKEIETKLLPGCKPLTHHELCSKIYFNGIGREVLEKMGAGVVFNAVIGEMIKDGRILETWDAAQQREVYSLGAPRNERAPHG